MQTHTDSSDPSQVKVGHRGDVRQRQVQALIWHFHLLAMPLDIFEQSLYLFRVIL